MNRHKSTTFVIEVVLASTLGASMARADDACQILARNFTPETLVQGSEAQRFEESKKLVSDNQYEDFNNASHSDFNGKLLSEYVDIFVKSKSDSSNWSQHRKEFLEMDASTAQAASANSTFVNTWNTAAISKIADCQVELARTRGGVNVTLDQVSPNRNSFAVRLTRATEETTGWQLKNLSAQPPDAALSCDNHYERASVAHPINLPTNTVLVSCAKSPNASFLLSVNTSAGAAARAFPIESVHEEIQQIRDETKAQIAALAQKVNQSGMVAAFNSTTCPSPWVPYGPAEGKFIRGIDPSGSHQFDADGKRAPGSIQDDAVKSHTHSVGVNGADSTTMVGGGGTQRLSHFSGDVYGGGGPKQTAPNDPAMTETRPKNVALLYCMLP